MTLDFEQNVVGDTVAAVPCVEPAWSLIALLTVAILEGCGSVILKQFAAAKTVMLNVVDVFKGETRDEALQNKKDGSSTSEKVIV